MTDSLHVFVCRIKRCLCYYFLICEAMILETNIKTRNLQLDFRKCNRQID